MTYGVKVSKPGYDVKTATAEQLIYSSVYSNLKIHSKLDVSVTLTGADTNGSNTISNPLPYTPLYVAYIEDATVIPGKWRPATSSGTILSYPDADLSYCTVNYRSGTDDFYVSVVHVGSGTRVFNIKIVLFVDVLQGDTQSLGARSGYGFVVSKEGKDVKTDNQADMSMDSDYASLTISSTSSVDVTGDPAEYHTGTYAHGLGYVPMFMTWITDDDTSYAQQPNTDFYNGTNTHSECWADSTYIYVVGYFTTHPIVVFNQEIV